MNAHKIHMPNVPHYNKIDLPPERTAEYTEPLQSPSIGRFSYASLLGRSTCLLGPISTTDFGFRLLIFSSAQSAQHLT